MTKIAPSLPQPVAAQPRQPERATREAAQAFEAQMLGALLQPMFQGLDTKGPFSGGMGEEQFRPMLVDEYGKILARNGGVGIADAVLRQLQEKPR